jgi:hypothetical protein
MQQPGLLLPLMRRSVLRRNFMGLFSFEAPWPIQCTLCAVEDELPKSTIRADDNLDIIPITDSPGECGLKTLSIVLKGYPCQGQLRAVLPHLPPSHSTALAC